MGVQGRHRIAFAKLGSPDRSGSLGDPKGRAAVALLAAKWLTGARSIAARA